MNKNEQRRKTTGTACNLYALEEPAVDGHAQLPLGHQKESLHSRFVAWRSGVPTDQR